MSRNDKSSGSLRSIKSVHVGVRVSGDGKILDAVSAAMAPETTQSNEREKKCVLHVTKSKIGNTELLEIAFETEDMVSLRASLNTNLRLISSSLKTLEHLS